MTNSKSVDNYGFMTAKPFVMNNSTYCLIDGIQFVIYTIAPDLLPFLPGSFMYVMGKERADLAAASALSLPGMLTWLGIQHRTIIFPEFVRVV